MQVNLEFLVVDKRTFVTDEERALQTLFGDTPDGTMRTRHETALMADRLATVFASLKANLFPIFMFA